MAILQSLIGKSFGRLTVIRHDRISNARHFWVCHCYCGTETTVRGSALTTGNTRSCGCLNRERLKARRVHGHTAGDSPKRRQNPTREYMAWQNAKNRCFNKANAKFANYGGRGITMCDRWRTSFINFIADMGPCPEGCTLDRKDNNGHYEQGNCRWANWEAQADNKQQTVWFSWGSERLTLKMIARCENIQYKQLYKRVQIRKQMLEHAVAALVSKRG